MAFFQEIEGEACVVVHKGVYRQVPVYTRDGYIYAKIGTGFVRIMADGSTTQSHTRLETISISELHRDPVGRLCLSTVHKSIPLPQPQQQQLIGQEVPPDGT